ncbi:MAG: hypothetical protein R3F65_10180 [bacterium]
MTATAASTKTLAIHASPTCSPAGASLGQRASTSANPAHPYRLEGRGRVTSGTTLGGAAPGGQPYELHEGGFKWVGGIEHERCAVMATADASRRADRSLSVYTDAPPAGDR